MLTALYSMKKLINYAALHTYTAKLFEMQRGSRTGLNK